MPKITLSKEQVQKAIETGCCPYCESSHRFRYTDGASTNIIVEEGIKRGNVSYGDDTHNGEIREVRCNSCDELISVDIWVNWDW